MDYGEIAWRIGGWKYSGSGPMASFDIAEFNLQVLLPTC
jgi:hypothetical protein